MVANTRQEPKGRRLDSEHVLGAACETGLPRSCTHALVPLPLPYLKSIVPWSLNLLPAVWDRPSMHAPHVPWRSGGSGVQYSTVNQLC